jgi:hypothetical protein
MICDELARSIASDQGGRVFRLLARLQAWDSPNGETPRATDAARARDTAPGPRWIGTWREVADARDTFVRTTHADAMLWAADDRIGPKTGSRVLLVGESAARGYFYDPHWNAAAALRHMLRASSGGNAVEVIDLARTDLGFHALVPLLESALALRPDACVLFAGNNWSPWAQLGWADARAIAALLVEADGWKEVRLWLEARQRTRVEALMASIGDLARRASLPIVVVIPEFNLVDWEDVTTDVPLLAREPLRAWWQERRVFDRHRGDGDHAAAARSAERLLAIDGGSMPVSLRAVAFARLREGHVQEARRLFEQARDTAMNIPVRCAPRCHTVTQDSMAAEATRAGMPVVDLRRVFDEAAGGVLPDRRFFLDYCHLTTEGVRVAMAAATSQVARMLGMPDLSRDALLGSAPAPAGDIQAAAHLLAANHNFNWAQRDDIVAYHCHAAATLDSRSVDDVTAFIDMHTRRPDAAACASFIQMAKDGRIAVERYLNPMHSPKRSKARLLDFLGDALERVRPGTRQWMTDLRAREQPMQERPIDLIEPFHSDAAYGSFEQSGESGRAFHRTFGSTSSFVFVLADGCDLQVSLVYRTMPAIDPDEALIVRINDAVAGSLQAAPAWRAVNLDLPRALLRPGVNTMALRWPLPAAACEIGLARVIDAVDRNVAEAIAELFPPWGDVAAFTLSAAEPRNRPGEPASSVAATALSASAAAGHQDDAGGTRWP